MDTSPPLPPAPGRRAPSPVLLDRPRVLPARHTEQSPLSSQRDEEQPDLPPPRRFLETTPHAQPPPRDGPQDNQADRTLLLAAARNAANRGDWETAVARFEEYFRRFGDDPAIRREFAGLLVQAGQAQRALREYQQLVNRDPNNVPLRVLLGDVSLLAGRNREAIGHYERALALRPDAPEIAARLARAHFFAGDATRALEVYDRHLAKLRPDDPRTPRALGAFLLDLGRHQDALSFLLALREREPDNPETLALLVRAHSLLGDRDKAGEALAELARKAPRALGVWLELADSLYSAGDHEMARRVYEEILKANPGNAHAQVGLARVQLQFFRPAEARRMLQQVKAANTPEKRILQLTWAEYHQAVGEYVEAKRIYHEFLRDDVNDHEARLALAQLHDFIRDHEKGKAEYSKIPPDSSLGRKSRLGFADVLAHQWRLAEAVDASAKLHAENPGDGTAAGQLVRHLGKSKRFDEAVKLARDYLAANTRNEPGSITVRFALGRVLLDSGHPAEAVGEYEWLLTRPGGRTTESYYGLARAHTRQGNHDRAKSLIAAALSLSPSDARNRILLADLHYGDNEDAPAIDLLQGVLERDPLNLSALIRMADAQLRVARFTAKVGPVLEPVETILNISPTNVRGHLGRARAIATRQDWTGSAAAYDKLIVVDPEFQVPRREKARVLFSGHNYGASQAAYREIQEPPASAVLVKDLESLALKKPEVRPLLECAMHAGIAPKAIRAEVLKAIDTSASEEIRVALVHLMHDFDALSAEQTGAHLEGEGKSLKDVRNYEAVPVYQTLSHVEPGNEEGLFDLGQVYGGLKQTLNALPQFSRVLELDPQHRESMIALERAGLELNPQFRTSVDFFGQRGRDGLAGIDRLKVGATATLPFGDENEFVSLGFFRVHYDPVDDDGLPGNILSLRAQKKFCDSRLLAHAQGNMEQYEDRMATRVTYDAGLSYDVCDPVRLRTSTFLENVVENGETMRQDIYRMGLTVGADVKVSRKWNFGGTYRYASYSDDNSANEMMLYSDYSFTLPPCQLKFVGTFFLQTFEEQTDFLSPDRAVLPGTRHPYFSPATYTYYEGRLEWYHWLSRDYFTYSNQLWYSLQYGIGWDDNLACYHDLRALFQWDVKSWLTVGAYAQGLLSPFYDSVGAGAYVVVRLPCCLRW